MSRNEVTALKNKIEELETRVKTLQKNSKEGTLAQNKDLVEKNKRLNQLLKEKDNSIAQLAKELATEKGENKYKIKKLLKKFGTESQMKKDKATVEEIEATMSNDLNWAIRKIKELELSEPETVNVILLLFLELTGNGRHHSVKRCLSFSTNGFRKHFYQHLKEQLGIKSNPTTICVQDGPSTQDLNTPTNQRITRNTIKLPNPKRLKLDVSVDPRDGFDKKLFLNDSNTDCAFIREGKVCFIAFTADRDHIRPHILGKRKCGISSCGKYFYDRNDMIAPVIICCPEDDENFGKEKVYACAQHFLKSIEPGEEYDLAEAAAELENGPKVARNLFTGTTNDEADHDAENNANLENVNNYLPYDPNEIYMSEDELLETRTQVNETEVSNRLSDFDESELETIKGAISESDISVEEEEPINVHDDDDSVTVEENKDDENVEEPKL